MLKYISLTCVFLLFCSYSSAQNCENENTSIISTTPTGDFVDNNNGTVTHTKTGLMWMRCSLGQNWTGSGCEHTAASYSWQGALVAAKGHSFAGYSDWRLPNINELESIVEERCWAPSINSFIFPNIPPNWFWSSSPAVLSNRNFVWSVDLYGSHYSNQFRESENYALLVRSAQ